MSNTTTTIYGAALQTALIRRSTLDFPPNTTLNEKYDIYPDARPLEGEYPYMRYFAIGRGGHRNITGGDGEPLNQLNWHLANHSALYNQLPFVLRPLSSDLSNEERVNYAHRKVITQNNVSYYAYYLKKMPETESSPQLLLTTIEDGEHITIPYTPSASDLNPTPPELDPDGDVIITNQYLSTTSPLVISLSTKDIEEIINACDIIYSNTAYAVISEISLVSGVSRNVTGDSNGSSVTYDEAMVAQCNVLQCTGPYDLNSINDSLDFAYELGASEMLAI